MSPPFPSVVRQYRERTPAREAQCADNTYSGAE